MSTFDINTEKDDENGKSWRMEKLASKNDETYGVRYQMNFPAETH